MNEEKSRQLWKIIQEAGDYLQGQLPDHPNHPKGRNSYAHVAICVKTKFKQSYKDIEDEKFNEVVEYINFLKKNPLSTIQVPIKITSLLYIFFSFTVSFWGQWIFFDKVAKPIKIFLYHNFWIILFLRVVEK